MTNPNQGTKGTKEIATRYPITSGLGANDKHDGRQINLVAEQGSNVYEENKKGLNI